MNTLSSEIRKAKEQPKPQSVIEQYREDLSVLSTDELKVELARSMQLTADHLARLAAIVRTLEERGENLSDLKIHMMPYLRQIAYGQVLPEVVVRYAESPMLIRSISMLPLPDQERMARGESVPMAVRGEDGQPDHRLVDPIYLRREQIMLVFARDRIRPLEEQHVLLESRPKSPKPATKSRPSSLRPDHDRGGIVLGKSFFSSAEIIEALAALGTEPNQNESDEPDGLQTKVLSIKLTEDEHQRLSLAAARGNTKMLRLVRRALKAYGVI